MFYICVSKYIPPNTIQMNAFSIAAASSNNNQYKIPIYEGISAGFPSPAEDYMEERLDLNRLLIKHPAATFFVKVEGASMIGAGIYPGDILVVDRSLQARSNDVVVAVLDGEFTVKRWVRESDEQGWLMAENPMYKPIEIGPDSDFKVWGVVTNVIHRL